MEEGMNRQLYLLAYDITDPGRLRHALIVARDYAVGAQKSVFEVYLTKEEIHELSDRLNNLIDPEEDRCLLIRLDPRGFICPLGRATKPVDPTWFYLD